MKETKADLILHPVRMRIVQALVNGSKLTVQQIGEKLDDIPQATLYRHLKKLVDGNIVTIVEKHKIRGTIEKVYGLPEQNLVLGEDDLAELTSEEHMSYFMKFLTTVLADFERYLSQENFNMQKDGVGYRQISFYATDEEFMNFVLTMNQEMMKLVGNEEDANRRKRTLTTILTAETNKKREE